MGQIIQIRGTSGSGKTTAASSLLNALCLTGYVHKRLHEEGRKQPLYHLLSRDDSGRGPASVAFLGHYNTPCGGVDTITKRSEAFELARWLVENEKIDIVIMEGVIMSDDVRMTVWLGAFANLKVYHLTTPLEVCLDSIKARRAAKSANPKELNPANTTKRVAAIQRACEKLRNQAVTVLDVSRGELELELLALLG